MGCEAPREVEVEIKLEKSSVQSAKRLFEMGSEMVKGGFDVWGFHLQNFAGNPIPA